MSKIKFRRLGLAALTGAALALVTRIRHERDPHLSRL